MSLAVAGDADAAGRRRRGRKARPHRAAAAAPAPALASAREPLGLVAATITAKLRAEPGESTPLVATVPAGARLEVMARSGRWLRVRHGKTLGWVTRTSVAGRAAEPEPEPTGGRWRDRFGGNADMDRTQYPLTTVTTAPVRRDQPAAAAPAPVPMATRVHAAGGARFRSLVMTTADPTTGYRLSGSAFTGGVGVDAVFGRSNVLIADGGYAYGRGGGAEVVDGAGASMGTVPFTVHDVDLGIAGGRRAAGGLFSARLGYRYEAVLVNDLFNPARLPSEHLHGPTVGVRAELMVARIWLRAGGDFMVAGQRAQTVGLEDGSSASVSAVFAQVAAGYDLGSLRLVAAYHLGHSRTTWSGPSNRNLGSEGATRSDNVQTMTVDLSRGF